MGAAAAPAIARVAELKAHLSHYLRVVREGHEVLIQDRDKPVARLVPVEAARKKLPIRIAKRSVASLNDLPAMTLCGVTPEDFEEACAESRRERSFL